MKLIISLLILNFFFVQHTFGQAGWNWPEDEKLYEQAQEKQAYYKVLMGQDKYEAALKTLRWLYTNNPNLNPSIYIDGAKSIEEVLVKDLTDGRRPKLEDSLLWMYDRRIEYFGDEAAVLDRKAYAAFKLYYKQPKKFGLLHELYKQAYQINGVGISNFNHVPYMTLAKYYHESQPEQMPGESVLAIHGEISEIIEEKLKMAQSDARLTKDQDKIDALLTSIEGLLTCEFIETTLVPKFQKDPTDIGTAKKIFLYSLKAKCSSNDYFVDAGEAIVKEEPEPKLLAILAERRMDQGDYDKALTLFQQAFTLATDVERQVEVLIGQARAYQKKGQLSKARQLAFEALGLSPGNSAAYNIIGSLYYSSFKNCSVGESRVKDRAVFFAAYDAFQKAGNSSQMAAAASQFPAIDVIFTEGYEEGQLIEVGCWINTKTTVRRRP